MCTCIHTHIAYTSIQYHMYYPTFKTTTAFFADFMFIITTPVDGEDA